MEVIDLAGRRGLASAFGATVISRAEDTGACWIVASQRDGGAWPPLGRDLHRG